MENELLKMENVSKSYLEDGGGDLLILRDINLTLKKGEVVAITGKSGCGKSTLLSVAALLSRRDNGKIYYSGLDVDQIPPKDLSALRNRKMGFVFQSSMLLEDFSALENVAMPLLIRGVGRKEAYSKAKEYLALVDIFDRMDHRPSRLSGGEEQRVAIARALIGQAEVVFADEPTGNLDEKNARIIEELLISTVKKAGRGLLLVTHNPLFASKADRTCVLSEGVLHEE